MTEHKKKKKIKLSRNGVARRRAQRQEYKYSLIFNVNYKKEDKKEKPVARVGPVDKLEGWGDNDSYQEKQKKHSSTANISDDYESSSDEDTQVNGMNVLPVVSQIKSLVLFLSGNTEEAIKVQSDFVTTCPVVSQVTSGVQLYQGDTAGAKQSWGRFCSFMNGTVNSIPIIGHAKSAYHKAVGDDESANEAFLAATRTTGVMAGGIAAIPGGPLGMMAGGIAAGTLIDGVVTKINSNEDEYRPSGVFAAVDEVKENPTVGGVFDAIAGVFLDGATGYVAGTSMESSNTKLTKTQKRNFLKRNAKARARGDIPKPRSRQYSGFKFKRGGAGAGANGPNGRRSERRRA